MLKKFSVQNYRRFNEILEFNLTAGNYTFNSECTHNGLIKLALIYGKNGTGKSVLGWAISDLISHLTDNTNNLNNDNNYLNALSTDKYSTFEYEFEFYDARKHKKNVTYKYQKDENKKIIYEALMIQGILVVEYHFERPVSINLVGAENLNKTINPSQNLSAIKYIYNNTSLDRRNSNNAIFIKFIEFVNHMLYFRSVFGGNNFNGYKPGDDNIERDILRKNNLKDFENFLNGFGLNLQLVNVKQLNKNIIGIKFEKKVLPFFEVVSTGTLSLTFFYYWWQVLKENEVPFLFIDEFDCSYHFELSEYLIRKLKELTNTQVILTTHNTNLLSNDLIRPDCGFIINGKTIKSLNNCTKKELREAHNLEKLYQAGHFDE